MFHSFQTSKKHQKLKTFVSHTSLNSFVSIVVNVVVGCELLECEWVVLCFCMVNLCLLHSHHMWIAWCVNYSHEQWVYGNKWHYLHHPIIPVSQLTWIEKSEFQAKLIISKKIITLLHNFRSKWKKEGSRRSMTTQRQGMFISTSTCVCQGHLRRRSGTSCVR